MSAEKSAAKSVMHEAGEAYLREEIRLLASQSRADTHHINSDNTFVLEKGEVLMGL